MPDAVVKKLYTSSHAWCQIAPGTPLAELPVHCAADNSDCKYNCTCSTRTNKTHVNVEPSKQANQSADNRIGITYNHDNAHSSVADSEVHARGRHHHHHRPPHHHHHHHHYPHHHVHVLFVLVVWILVVFIFTLIRVILVFVSIYLQQEF